MESEKKSFTIYIVWESIVSVILGVVFIVITWNKDEFWGGTIADSIIRFFGGLSLIFFFSVFSIGIVAAVRLGRTDKILRAILYSICCWVLSLAITVVVANFLLMGSLLVILAGIICGFNLGLRHRSEYSN